MDLIGKVCTKLGLDESSTAPRPVHRLTAYRLIEVNPSHSFTK